MCDYCISGKEGGDIEKFIFEKDGPSKFNCYQAIEYGGMLSFDIYYGNEEIISLRKKIKYCPMCGEKLTKGAKKK